MSRFILVTVLLAPTLVGCNRFPDLSIQINANLVPDDSDCSVTADQDTVYLRGLYDLNVIADYVINARVESYIVSNALEFQGEQGNMQITSFDITVLLPDGTVLDFGESLPNPYRVSTSAVIPPSVAGEASEGAAFAVGIPVAYQSAVAAAVTEAGFQGVTLEIRANGTTSGGFSQNSPPFGWPVDLCSGCLGIVCEEPSVVGESLGCYPGQDNWTYCASIVPPTTP